MADFHSFDSRTFQSTLPARGATDAKADIDKLLKISIHAPRTGSDVTVYNKWFCRFRFQSTLPARGATTMKRRTIPFPRFQSTLPARGATTSPISSGKSTTYFNPRSPHGERRESSRKQVASIRISIHAPRTGSDKVSFAQPNKREIISIHAPRTGSDEKRIALYTVSLFQSTLPARGATV